MKPKLILILLFTFLIGGQMFSEEGMYPLSEIQKLDLKAAGFLIDSNEIYNPNGISLIDTIAHLGFCTGSFVSSNGLILTNHHCSFRAIQAASCSERDYLKNGFSANERSREVEAKGYTVRITESYHDVSAEVLAVINDSMSFTQRTKAIEKKTKEMVIEAEKKYPGKRASVAEMFPGKTYVIFISTYLKDIRLVYAPPRDIGEFGGETDNWMWPRHTGDFSFLRAYAGPDGKPANYSPDNVPYHPKKYLKINSSGVNEEDLVFILGYPGRTYRHRTSYFIAFEKDIRMPYVVQANTWMIKVLEAMGGQDRSVQLKLAPRIKNLSNRLKNYRGKLIGLERIGLIRQRSIQEADLQKFILSDPQYQKRYGSLLDKIREFYEDKTKTADFEQVMDLLKNSSVLLNTAFTLYESSVERLKTDSERKKAYMNRNFERTRKRLKLRLNDFHQPSDSVIFKEFLMRASRLEGQRISGIDMLLGKDKEIPDKAKVQEYEKQLDSFLKKAYAETRLNHPGVVKEWFFLSSQELKERGDPFLDLAISLYPQYRKLDEMSKKRKGILDDLSARLIDIKRQFLGGNFIPDGNSTLRLTFGRIRGYCPRDAVHFRPLTTLKGIIEKNTGRIPFRAPQRLLELYGQRDFGSYKHPGLNDVPVAMLYNADTTGGNSGSPVLNARGELVGLNFDRTFEATINDYAWNEKYSRSIGVDVRYILWFVEKFSNAFRLLKEMETGI
jgi:hypothetical protein